MLRTPIRRMWNFAPYSSWECNARWQYEKGKHFQLSVPIYMRYDANTIPKIESWRITESEIIFNGFLFEEVKSPPNKIVDIEYNGKKGW